jgi:hypothetical protein
LPATVAWLVSGTWAAVVAPEDAAAIEGDRVLSLVAVWCACVATPVAVAATATVPTAAKATRGARFVPSR